MVASSFWGLYFQGLGIAAAGQAAPSLTGIGFLRDRAAGVHTQRPGRRRRASAVTKAAAAASSGGGGGEGVPGGTSGAVSFLKRG